MSNKKKNETPKTEVPTTAYNFSQTEYQAWLEEQQAMLKLIGADNWSDSKACSFIRTICKQQSAKAVQFGNTEINESYENIFTQVGHIKEKSQAQYQARMLKKANQTTEQAPEVSRTLTPNPA
jgi:hypothetical protein